MEGGIVGPRLMMLGRQLSRWGECECENESEGRGGLMMMMVGIVGVEVG